MTRQRSSLAGCTDYSGYSIEDMVSHLRDWRENTDIAIRSLEKHLEAVRINSNHLYDAASIEEYVSIFLVIFRGFSGDFNRLINEIPRRVCLRHVTLTRQIYERSKEKDYSCADFKREHICRAMKDGSLRHSLLDEIYSDTRGMVTDYLDLSNLAYRLETFIGAENEIFDLKPSVYGIRINLRALLVKVTAHLKKMR